MDTPYNWETDEDFSVEVPEFHISWETMADWTQTLREVQSLDTYNPADWW